MLIRIACSTPVGVAEDKDDAHALPCSNSRAVNDSHTAFSAMRRHACGSDRVPPIAVVSFHVHRRIYATRLDQTRVMRQLEKYLQHSNSAIRTKASLLLMTATYRLA